MDCDKAMTGLWCCCSRNALVSALKVMTSTAPGALAAHGDSVAVRELGRYPLAGPLRHRLQINRLVLVVEIDEVWHCVD